MPKPKKSSHNHAPQVRPGISVSSALRLRIQAGVALIIIVTFFAYLPSINGGFIWDDEWLLTGNDLIKASDGLYRFWCTTEAIDYWPVTNTTFWLEWRLWGMNSTGYHVTNLILHIAAALLIWVILRKLSIPGAFLAAMIFAVHPVNVESVSWIAQRKNLTAMLFFLLSILCYLKLEIPSPSSQKGSYRITTPLTPGHHVSGRSPLWYGLSLLAFVLAMLSKGSVAVLPVLLLGIVWWRRKVSRWDLARVAPFFMVAVVLAAVNLWFQTHGTGEIIRTASFVERLLGAGIVVWFYLYKALLPLNLVFVYPQWHIQAENLVWWLPLLSALAVTAILWWYRASWSRPVLFAWGFFCVSLAPVLGFVDVYFMKFSLVADHYQHIAFVGVIALGAACWGYWHECVRGSARWATSGVAVVVVCALTILTWQQNELYRDDVTLYQATLGKNPDCWMAYNNLGAKLLNAGRRQEAIEYFEQALRLKADYPEAHNNLGVALEGAGRLPEAIKHYEQAMRLKVDYIDAYHNLTLTYVQTSRPAEAIATAQKALEFARSKGKTALAKKIEDWLNSYRASQPELPSAPASGEPAPRTH